MERTEIVKQVAVRLNELTPYESTEEVPGYDFIEKLLDDSTRTVFRVLPYFKLPLTDLSQSRLLEGDLPGEWYLDLHTDFIKFGECKFKTWTRVVKEIAGPNTEKLQGSKFTMGTPSRPVVVLRKTSSDKQRLHFFSDPDGSSSGEKKLFVVLFKKPEVCPDHMIDAITWQCASDVLLSIGKTEAAKTAQEKVLAHAI